jgi:nicotinamide-nucleotide amidase
VSEAARDLAFELVRELSERRMTVAVAESLTGGLLVAEFIRVPGASAVINGGVVAYNTELKHTLLGVDAALLASHGPVHPDVAAAMALGVRTALAVGGRPATIGLSTTGVAGPDPQDGQAVGTVFVGIAIGEHAHILSLSLEGSRETIRSAVVSECLAQLKKLLGTVR